MKIYKKILSAFGGAALYLDKEILKALEVGPGDEIIIDIKNKEVTLKKPMIDANKIKEILDANPELKKGI